MVTTAMDRKLEQLGTARVGGLYKNYVCTDRHLKLAFIYEVSQVLSDLTIRKYKKFIFTKTSHPAPRSYIAYLGLVLLCLQRQP